MPVWLTVLLAALAIFSPGALIGVWLGTSMSQRGAEALGKQTLDGQRLLANDAAVREWRRHQVQPYLDAADQRVHFWLERTMEQGLARMPYHTTDKDGNDILVQPEPLKQLPGYYELDEVVEQLFEPTFYNLGATVKGIPSKAFRDAFQGFVLVEMEAQKALYGEPPPNGLHAHTAQITAALAALNEAAERYIFSPAA